MISQEVFNAALFELTGITTESSSSVDLTSYIEPIKTNLTQKNNRTARSIRLPYIPSPPTWASRILTLIQANPNRTGLFIQTVQSCEISIIIATNIPSDPPKPNSSNLGSGSMWHPWTTLRELAPGDIYCDLSPETVTKSRIGIFPLQGTSGANLDINTVIAWESSL